MLKSEWKGLIKSKFFLIIMIAIIAIPTIYTTLFLGSMWDPYGKVDQLPVAVVNHDVPVSYNGVKLNVGEELIENLRKNESLDFRFVGDEKAEQGLADGTYYMVITVPDMFSQNASTLMDTEPYKMELQYATNPGTNYIASKMSETALQKIKESVAQEVTKTYAKTVFDQITAVGDGMQEASDGAAQIEDGTDKLGDGNKTVTDNLKVLADSTLTFQEGSDTLAVGLKSYTEGLAKVDQGVQELQKGAGDLQNGLGTAKDGSDSLVSGTGEAALGAAALKTGAEGLDSGMSQLNGQVPLLQSGVTELASGSSALASGTAAAKAGSGQLKSAVQTAEIGSAQVTEGAQALENGLKNLASSSDGLNQGIESVNTSLDQVIANFPVTAEDHSDLAVQSEQEAALASQNETVSTADLEAQLALAEAEQDAAKAIAIARQAIQAANENQAAAEAGNNQIDRMASLLGQDADALNRADETNQLAAFKQELQEVRKASGQLSQGIETYTNTVAYIAGVSSNLSSGALQVSNGTKQISKGASDLYNGISTANDGAGQVAQGTKSLEKKVPELANGMGQLSEGASQLLGGASTLAEGSGQLSAGSKELASGLEKLLMGSTQLNQGTQTLAAGTGELKKNSPALVGGSTQLSDGADQIHSGAGRLYDGSNQLGEGIGQLAKGSGTLKEELSKGADQVKETTAADDNLEMFSAPVDSAETMVTEVENNGHAMAPYMMSVALWVGCIAFCIMYPLMEYSGKLTSGIRWWASKASVLFVIAVAQAVVMIAALHLLNGFAPEEMGKTMGVAILASVTFMAILYFFNVCIGKAGSFLMLIFMVIQLAGSAGTYPVELSGTFVSGIHNWLPFTYTVNAFRSTISGGQSISTTVFLLAILLAVFTAMTIFVFHVRTKRLKAGKQTTNDILEKMGLL